MDNKEVWKKVEGYDQPIEVSNLGNVRRTDGKSIKVVTHRVKGYNHVGVSINGHATIALVHRLVANAFIPKIEGKDEIDHINTIKTDNRVENLRWVNHKENCNNPLSIEKYKARVGERNSFFGKKHSQETLKILSELKKGKKRGPQSEETKEKIRLATSKAIIQFSINGDFLREWPSIKAAGLFYGKGSSSICACCRGRKDAAYGFKWKYAV